MKNILMLILAIVMIAPSISAQKLKAEEIIAKHVASIASPEKMATIKTLMAVGEVKVEFITQKNQPATGRIIMASQGNKSFFGMQLNAGDYPQELVIFDGSKTDIAMVRAGSRSLLGNFLQSNTSMISQGLLGGGFSTGWNLLNAAERGAKISTAGGKKIEGRETYGLKITPKGGSDLDITMYFDQETFHHLRTEYSRVSSSAMGATINESARNRETRIKLTEDFSDHKAHEGVTMPRKYKLYYNVSGQNGTTEISWTANFNEFAVNQALDDSTFFIRN